MSVEQQPPSTSADKTITTSDGRVLPPLDVKPPEARYRDDEKGEETRRQLEQERKRKRNRIALSVGAVAGVVLSAGAALGIHSFNSTKNELLGDLPDTNPNASGPVTPGEDTGEQAPIAPTGPTLETPEYEYPEMTYAEAWKPAQLTTEQMNAWNSGDQKAMSDVFSQVMIPRIDYALYDISRAGEGADISFVSTDPAVAEKLAVIVDVFDTNVPGQTPFAFNVCRTDIDYSGSAYDPCNPERFLEPLNLVPQAGEKSSAWVVARNTMEDSFGNEFPDNSAPVHLEVTPTISADGIMSLVSTQ